MLATLEQGGREMVRLPSVEIDCITNEGSAKADILERSPTRLKVAVGKGRNSITLVMTKKTPKDLHYVGHHAGLQFATTGKEIR